MDDRKISLWVLGIIVILAIVGLFFLFKSAKTGAGFVSHTDYPAFGGKSGAYSNTNPFPYYRSSYGADMPTELPGYQTRMPYQHDWAWRRDPSNTYGAKKGRCAILATPEIAQVPAGYTADATWNQAQSQFGMANCIRDENSLSGYCCKRTQRY